MKTAVERQLEVAVDALKLNRSSVTNACALAEIEAIGKEGEVDAAIERLDEAVRSSNQNPLVFFAPAIRVIFAEVRRLRAEAKDG